MPCSGKWTGCDLMQSDALFAEPFGQYAAEFCIELAADVYQMNTAQWKNAGFGDFSFLEGNKLLTGSKQGMENSVWQTLTGNVLQQMAKLRIFALNPFAQMQGIRREDGEQNNCKALFFMKGCCVYIAFMGSGKLLSDWAYNIRINRKNGIHEGFLTLTEDVLGHAADIAFPDHAKELGLPRLTLQDILEDLCSKNGKFRLLCTGHSRGGAVAQIFLDLLMKKGADKVRMRGVTFAAPSVYDAMYCTADIPCVNLLFDDDLVPFSGADRHGGSMLSLYPDEPLIQSVYGEWAQDTCFREIRQMLSAIRSVKSLIVFLFGLVDLLKKAPGGLLNELLNTLPASASRYIEGKKGDLLDGMKKRLEKNWQELYGSQPLPRGEKIFWKTELDKLIARYSASQVIKCLSKAIFMPHKLCRKQEDDLGPSGYLYMVTEGFDRLHASHDGDLNNALCVASRREIKTVRHKPLNRYCPLRTGRRSR